MIGSSSAVPRTSTWRDAVLEEFDDDARHRRTGRAPQELRRAQPRTSAGRPLELLASRALGRHRRRSSPKRRRILGALRRPRLHRQSHVSSASKSIVSRGVAAKDALFTWPEQAGRTTSSKRSATCSYTGVGVERGYGYLPDIDIEKSNADDALARASRRGGRPAGGDDVRRLRRPAEKPGVLVHLAAQILDPVARRSRQSGVDGAAGARTTALRRRVRTRTTDSSATTWTRRWSGWANSTRATSPSKVRRDRARPTAARTSFTRSSSPASASASPR